MKAKFLKLIAVVTLLGNLLVVQTGSAFAAGNATLSLSPSSGSYKKGATFAVTIHENSGSTQVNAVEADLTYSTSKLQFVSIDTNSSAFDIGARGIGGSGSVEISRAKSGGSLTGDQIVAKVNFKALAGSGSTSITFADIAIKPKNHIIGRL